MNRADAERALLRDIAEDAESREVAISSLLLGHERDWEPSWTCACGHRGRLGESHSRHVAAQLLGLMLRRGWLA